MANGNLCLNDRDGAIRENYKIFEAGVVPYEWIEYVDERGDEFSYRPHFFVTFDGTKKYPYKYLNYYIDNKNYQKETDPFSFQWKKVGVEK